MHSNPQYASVFRSAYPPAGGDRLQWRSNKAAMHYMYASQFICRLDTCACFGKTLEINNDFWPIPIQSMKFLPEFDQILSMDWMNPLQVSNTTMLVITPIYPDLVLATKFKVKYQIVSLSVRTKEPHCISTVSEWSWAWWVFAGRKRKCLPFRRYWHAHYSCHVRRMRSRPRTCLIVLAYCDKLANDKNTAGSLLSGLSPLTQIDRVTSSIIYQLHRFRIFKTIKSERFSVR